MLALYTVDADWAVREFISTLGVHVEVGGTSRAHVCTLQSGLWLRCASEGGLLSEPVIE